MSMEILSQPGQDFPSQPCSMGTSDGCMCGQRSFHVCRVICFDPPAPITHGFSSYLNQTQIRLAFIKQGRSTGPLSPYQSISPPVFIASPPQIPLFLQETSKEKQTWRPTPAKPTDQIKSPRQSPNVSAPRCLSS